MMTKMMIPVALILAFFVGCSDNDDNYDPAPPTPQGVYSVTADNAVYVYWSGPYDRDIKKYFIWRSFNPVSNYEEIGERLADDNPNLDLITYEYIDNTAVNGNTYYYAVTAMDFSGQESELSAEDVFDTPRPEGEAIVYDISVNPDLGAFCLATGATVPRTSSLADFFIDRDLNGTFYINADTLDNYDTQIQDLGYTSNFDDIGWAPEIGWSSNGWAEVVPYHTYVIRTDQLHYAKVRILGYNVGTGAVSFQWAYQTDQGNPELTPIVSGNNQDSDNQPGAL